jgi:glycogen synthase
MLGWELPPYNSGGLGTASLGLTEGLAPLGVNIRFVVPKVFGPMPYQHMEIVDASGFGSEDDFTDLIAHTEGIEELIASSVAYGNRLSIDEKKRIWVEHVGRGQVPVPPKVQAAWYARKAARIAKQSSDAQLIHTHDWMTYHAGLTARQVMQRSTGAYVPVLAHVHATEIDRSGVTGDPSIIAIEKEGLHAADRIIAVSHYTKEIVRKYYGVPKNKISVVYNGIPTHREPAKFDLSKLKEKYKIVLFMGRITMQKGPDYFVKLAKAVTDVDPNIRFVMVGSGDMERRCVEEAAHRGLTGKMLFSSFLRGEDVDRAYQLADLFVMPSVSEPFGIVALEAIQNGTPVLVSKQSGVSEVSDHMIKVDFWDINRMRDEVLHVLQTPDHHTHLTTNGRADLSRLSWHDSARALHSVYREVASLSHRPATA